MKIKRYFAPDIRQAIRLVRDNLGPDAVILGNVQVEGGVELIAAVDYDEEVIRQSAHSPKPARPSAPAPASPGKAAHTPDPALVAMRREMKSLRGLLEQQMSSLAWGDLARRHPLRARLIQNLNDAGLSPELSRQIAAKVKDNADYDAAWRQALAVLAHQIQVTDDDILSQGGVVALVGPTGVGKTTTIAKLAARFVLRHGARHVALITADNYRIGAHEQLSTYGRILGLPVMQVANAQELRSALTAFQDKRLVLIDTAGMSQRDVRLAEQLKTLRDGAPSIKSYLVLSATSQMSTLLEIARAYQSMRLSGSILTKLDESTSLGGLLSLVIRAGLPVAYVSEGQRVPEDLAAARAHQLVASGISLAARSARYATRDPQGEGTVVHAHG